MLLSYMTGLWLTIGAAVFHGIGIFLTAFRLHYRRRIQRLWWDDYTAGVTLVADILYVPMMLFTYAPSDSVLYSKNFLAVKFWVRVALFTLITWLSRISIVLAIARVFPPGEPIRRFCVMVAYIFVIFMLSVIVEFAVYCPSMILVVGNPNTMVCNVRDLFGFTVSEVIMELISDVFLIATPLYKLWRVRLPQKQRRLILTGFATSFLTTVIAVTCAIFQFGPSINQSISSRIAPFETAVALIDCNFLVIIAYIHTRRRYGQETRGMVPPETCSDASESDRESVSHSNHVPNSSALTTLSLTQITMSYGTVELEPYSQGPSKSGGTARSSPQNSEDMV